MLGVRPAKADLVKTLPASLGGGRRNTEVLLLISIEYESYTAVSFHKTSKARSNQANNEGTQLGQREMLQRCF